MKKIAMCSTLNKSAYNICGFTFVRPNWDIENRGLMEEQIGGKTLNEDHLA